MEKAKVDLKARSPWSALAEKMVEVSPNEKRLDARLVIPGSKSLTNRALIISALADGKSTLNGILKSDDSYWCIDALKKAGIDVTVENHTAHVTGKSGQWHSGDLYIGAAGTIARFLPGALAVSGEGKWTLEASHRMSERPVAPLINGLKSLGADINYLKKEGYYPLEIKGGVLKGGEYAISGKISSQFISGLLIAAPYATNPVTIRITDYIVQHAYVHLTLQMMEQFGAVVEYDDSLQKMVVHPSHYKPKEVDLEADASTAAYFLGAAALTNGKVRIDHLSYDTVQPDIKMIDVFEKMGCKVTKGEAFIELEGVSQLKGGFEISMREMSDQTLTLASIAPFCDGPITIRDVAHIRHHESDRISVMCEALTKIGIKVEEFEDGMKIYPGTPKPAVLDSHDDHRVAMSLSLIGTRVNGIQITDPGCVSKTCPNYFELLKSIGMNVSYL